MTQQYAVVDASGHIVNVVQWDGTDDWAPPEGTTAVQISGAQIGGTYVDGVYTPPAASIPAPLTVEQRAAAAIAAGIVLTCTGNSALDASYPIGPNTETYLIGIISYIGLKGTFTGGATTMNWYDAENAPHNFTMTQFEAFAEAMCAFVQAVTEWELGGGQGALPSNAVTIP